MQHLYVLSIVLSWTGIIFALRRGKGKKHHFISDYVAEKTIAQAVFQSLITVSSVLFLVWLYWVSRSKLDQPVLFLIGCMAVMAQITTAAIPRLGKTIMLHDVVSNTAIILFGVLLLAYARLGTSSELAEQLTAVLAVTVIAYMLTAILYVRKLDVTLYGQIIVISVLQFGLLLITYS